MNKKISRYFLMYTLALPLFCYMADQGSQQTAGFAKAKPHPIIIEGCIIIKNEAPFDIDVSIEGLNVSHSWIDETGNLSFEEIKGTCCYIRREEERHILYTGLHVTNEINLAEPKLVVVSQATKVSLEIDLSAEYKYSYDMRVCIGAEYNSVMSMADGSAQKGRIQCVKEHFDRLIKKARAEKNFLLAGQLGLYFDKIRPTLTMKC